MARMNQDIKAEWIKNLRSGEYKQGQERLRQQSKDPSNEFVYCCLGVLTDLYCKATGKTWAEVQGDREDENLPDEVAVWAGTRYSTQNPDVTCAEHPLGTSISDLNDGVNGCKQYTFNEIADIIEAQF